LPVTISLYASAAAWSQRHVSSKARIVVLLAVERRVEVDQVHRLVGDVAAEDVEVVAVIQRVADRLCVHRPGLL